MGIFFEARNLLEDMALVMCVGALTAVLCQLLRQPLVVGYLIAGMVVGPHTPGLVVHTHRVQLLAHLGVTILIFSIGLEFKFRRLIRLAPTAGLVALIQAASMICLGYLATRLMGWTRWDSLVTGAIVSISGAVIIARALEEVRVDARVRELVFGVVLCEDVIAILLLAVFNTLANGGELSLGALSINAGLLISFIIAVIVIGLITVPHVVRRVARSNRRETLLITGLGLCFAFAVIAERLGYSLVLGAFLAGSLVAESGQGAEVEKLIEPVRHVFGAIFFVSVGMLIEPQVLATHWFALIVLSTVVVAGKIISVTLASALVGERPDTAVKTGFAMAQIGVFSILIAGIGPGGFVARGSLYSLAVGVVAITAFLCPLLVRASKPAGNWIDHHLPLPVQSALSRYGGWLDRIRKSPEPAMIEGGEAGESESTVHK
jgi:CPA2 family monovalent cation:H+ antiporter-2